MKTVTILIAVLPQILTALDFSAPKLPKVNEKVLAIFKHSKFCNIFVIPLFEETFRELCLNRLGMAEIDEFFTVHNIIILSSLVGK